MGEEGGEGGGEDEKVGGVGGIGIRVFMRIDDWVPCRMLSRICHCSI